MGNKTAVFILGFWLVMTGFWVTNIVQLVQCDWDKEGSWKGEIVHSLGVVIPITSFGTVFVDEK